jgi:hypothetical protein
MVNRVNNIGPEGQRMRMRAGLLALGLGVIAGVLLAAFDTSRWWRLVLFLPFWQGGLGVFQARNKT